QALLEPPRPFEVGRQLRGVALLGEALPLQAQAALDESEQHPAAEGLEEEIDGPLLQRPEELLVGLRNRARDEDDVHLRPALPESAAQAVAVAIFEAHV